MVAKGKTDSGLYVDPHADLFERIEDRRRRHLFLPSVLNEAASDNRQDTPQRTAAYEIIRQWWQKASQGALNRKETSIDDAFLREVFGRALGYRGVMEAEKRYERERQFHVPGVGPCDGALGQFPPATPDKVRVVIELKDAMTHLDHARAGSARTPVQQMWDYLNAMPESCAWGIVSNFTTIRLYHRSRGSQVYEQFRLRELAEDRQEFNRFYAIFEPYGLLKGILKLPPRADEMLSRTIETQREVGHELYTHYSQNRLRLIEYLHGKRGLALDVAIRVAQKLIDRVLFIAFCEDRGLISPSAIDRACREVPAFSRTPNPVWQNFRGLFHAMDKGSPAIGVENGYNGGLFRDDEDCRIDALDLEDVPWTVFFRSLGRYDYRHTVDVDVLGHLFEKSVTELERLREGGLFAKDTTPLEAPMMPNSPQRKLFGIYYTPVEFTTAIVQYTIDEVVAERFEAIRRRHGLEDQAALAAAKPAVAKACWQECLEALKGLRVCDPACGSGAFLIRAYDALFHHYALAVTELDQLGAKGADDLYDAIPDLILHGNLYGVDLQPEAVEIAQLSLWLRTARPGKTLADLSANIVCGNSLADDPNVHPRALKWERAFPDVFGGDNPGFDCVIGNPPWERLKLQEREFFALSAPHIASAVSAAERRRLIEELAEANPELHAKYVEALRDADAMLNYARTSGRYPLTSKGDVNTYMLFAELAQQIVAPEGRVGLLVPSGIATDKTTAKFFNKLMAGKSLQRLYDFENRKRIFQDVDSRFKFSILNFGGSATRFRATDFVFFAHGLQELDDPHRHIPLSMAHMKRMNPNTKTCPIFRHRRSAEITEAIYGRVPVLIDRGRKEGGNPWGIRFLTMFHQTNDAESFITPEALKTDGYRLEGNRWLRDDSVYLPLYEAKMVQAYDHRAASVEVVKGNWVRQGQPIPPTLVERQNPEHVAMPRWWVGQSAVAEALDGKVPLAMLVYKDVTSPTNQRTMIASFIPLAGVVNSAPIVLADSATPRQQCCLLANLNSVAYDFVARQKVGNVHLNYFIVEQLPTLPPHAYAERCPWDGGQTLERWISDRVLRLSCTADDMKPLAEACGMRPPVNPWNVAERSRLLAELDAAFFILYGLSREDVRYVLTTFQAMRAKGGLDEAPAGTEQELSPLGRHVLHVYDELAPR